MFRKLVLSGALALALPASTLGCDFGCKIRVHACEKARPSHCISSDMLPEETGLCMMMSMGVATEWAIRHPDMMFKSAECVAPDDERV